MSKAKTAKGYLDELPEERRSVMKKVRELVVKNLPKGYKEEVGYGSICYVIPLDDYPETYNGQPLSYAAIAAQKNHYAIYLLSAYMDPKQTEALKAAFAKAGKKLDMGKSCLRFKKLEDIPMDAVAKVIAGTPPKKFIELYEKNRGKK